VHAFACTASRRDLVNLHHLLRPAPVSAAPASAPPGSSILLRAAFGLPATGSVFGAHVLGGRSLAVDPSALVVDSIFLGGGTVGPGAVVVNRCARARLQNFLMHVSTFASQMVNISSLTLRVTLCLLSMLSVFRRPVVIPANTVIVCSLLDTLDPASAPGALVYGYRDARLCIATLPYEQRASSAARDALPAPKTTEQHEKATVCILSLASKPNAMAPLLRLEPNSVYFSTFLHPDVAARLGNVPLLPESSRALHIDEETGMHMMHGRCVLNVIPKNKGLHVGIARADHVSPGVLQTQHRSSDTTMSTCRRTP